jgi:hypothetical protein
MFARLFSTRKRKCKKYEINGTLNSKILHLEQAARFVIVVQFRGGGTFSNQVRLSIRLLVTIQNFYVLP